jgi:hypothetical protein
MSRLPDSKAESKWISVLATSSWYRFPFYPTRLMASLTAWRLLLYLDR